MRKYRNRLMRKYRFFQNTKCEYFPCHAIDNKKGFNCLMCYCPLYYTDNCGGNFIILKNGVKDCSNCLLPHYDYDLVVEKLTQYNLKAHNKK